MERKWAPRGTGTGKGLGGNPACCLPQAPAAWAGLHSPLSWASAEKIYREAGLGLWDGLWVWILAREGQSHCEAGPGYDLVPSSAPTRERGEGEGEKTCG